MQSICDNRKVVALASLHMLLPTRKTSPMQKLYLLYISHWGTTGQELSEIWGAT